MNINKADALDAFRALRGAFVYSTEDIVPMQGQNLATMDWQDFEHLIREVLAKEYAKEGSDVRITRASRDKGVDAVVFLILIHFTVENSSCKRSGTITWLT